MANGGRTGRDGAGAVWGSHGKQVIRYETRKFKMSQTNAVNPMRVIRTGEGLRDALFDVLDGLRSGTMAANQAIAAAKVACQIINTVKVEVEYQAHIQSIRSSGNEPASIGTLRLGAAQDA